VSAATPYDLLGLYRDRTRPFVTHYDGPDSRIELSVASVANAVAKASSMLRDGLGLAPGAVVSVDLPRHWQLPVWVLAALSVGATVGRDLEDRVDVRIVGPAGLARIADGADPGADEVLGCSCDAFGLPVPGGVPGGVIDVGVEVRAHPDQFSPEPDAARMAEVVIAGVAESWAQVQSGGDHEPGARLWVDESTPEPRLLHSVAVQPLLARGSVVIATGLDVTQASRVRAVEVVTGRAGQ
jgi:uncharacterized protein (TIGR03089 family)